MPKIRIRKNKGNLEEQCKKHIVSTASNVTKLTNICMDIDTKVNHIIERFKDIYINYRTNNNYNGDYKNGKKLGYEYR